MVERITNFMEKSKRLLGDQGSNTDYPASCKDWNLGLTLEDLTRDLLTDYYKTSDVPILIYF